MHITHFVEVFLKHADIYLPLTTIAGENLIQHKGEKTTGFETNAPSWFFKKDICEVFA